MSGRADNQTNTGNFEISRAASLGLYQFSFPENVDAYFRVAGTFFLTMSI